MIDVVHRDGLELLEVDGRVEARMDPGDVVALDEVVDVDLPVRVEHQALGAIRLEGLDGFVGKDADRVAEVREQRFDGVDGDEQQPAPLVDTDRLQRPIGHVEVGVLAEPRRALQGAVEAVDPVVVGALDRLAMPAAFLQQPCAAMDAHVSKGMEHAVVGADDEHLRTGNFSSDVVAGCGDVRRRAEQLPRPPEDAFALRLMNRRVAVEPRVQVANHNRDRTGVSSHRIEVRYARDGDVERVARMEVLHVFEVDSVI